MIKRNKVANFMSNNLPKKKKKKKGEERKKERERSPLLGDHWSALTAFVWQSRVTDILSGIMPCCKQSLALLLNNDKISRGRSESERFPTVRIINLNH